MVNFSFCSRTQEASQPQASAPGAAPGSWRTSLPTPQLRTTTDTKEPRTARVNPTPTRRLFNIPDSSSSWLSRSSSYTRRLNSTGCDLSSSTPSLPRSSSYGRRLDDPTVTSTTGTGSSCSAGLSRLNILVAQRLAQEQCSVTTTTSNSVTTTTSNSVTTTTPNSVTTSDLETKQRRKSYLTPVRDEEAEAQRKARSRHARQSRRSTQGVTLTDLQEAEKTMKTDKGTEKTKEEEEEKKRKKAEEEVSWRSRIASLQKSDLLGLTQPAGTLRPQTSGQESSAGGESESDRIVRERRRARRRAQRAGESDDNDMSGEEGFGGNGQDPQTDSHSSTRSDVSCNDRGGGSETKDYKKLLEEVSRENGQLQSQLQDAQRTISQTRLDLDKVTQRQERFSCSATLELEKKERRMLERRVAELEAELKVLGDLRADNQRLKDENGALIRVISKLSK
ncbi:protein phosphatase 1 regulatory subunit 12A-like [Coregonus clupeaformis]|uniref:protein phosphatase 1 regulatory subunit 12A-like n=1 Tax=Coregonus clupeaformis TaxID=59861 RepID=UPI001E1C5BC0|nr:protein phosphatase 1 regulatory subunit 12A-like [Coregonus clupeaformis]